MSHLRRLRLVLFVELLVALPVLLLSPLLLQLLGLPFFVAVATRTEPFTRIACTRPLSGT